MRLENLVIDVHDPELVGNFWARALGAEAQPHDQEVEFRLHGPGDFWIDLCFQGVLPAPPDPDTPRQTRLHLDLLGGTAQDETVARLLALGARPADIGQSGVPWVVLADPEGNTFCVMEERAEYRDTGPIAALPLDSADPERDARFWAALTGWTPVAGSIPHTLRHPGGRGPLLEFCPEPTPRTTKLTTHLDVRAEPGDPDLVEVALDLGAHRVEHTWGDLPWTVLTDPSGNDFCVLKPER